MFPKLCTTELLDIYICCQKFRLLLCQAALYQAWSEHFPTLFISSVTQAMRSSSSLMLSSCCEILFCMALWKSKDSNQLDQVHGSYHRMGCTQLVIIQRLHWLWMICQLIHNITYFVSEVSKNVDIWTDTRISTQSQNDTASWIYCSSTHDLKVSQWK